MYLNKEIFLHKIAFAQKFHKIVFLSRLIKSFWTIVEKRTRFERIFPIYIRRFEKVKKYIRFFTLSQKFKSRKYARQ